MKRKRNFGRRRLPPLLCGLLCAALLSGCAKALPALADGADTVLQALAEGADRIAGALADLTDNAWKAAAGQADGEWKDAVLEAYGSLVGSAGSWALTPDRSLQGERVPGEDGYTGSYQAEYENFSGTELLFGGTVLEREGGGAVELSLSLDGKEGEAAVFLCSGSDGPVSLLTGSGNRNVVIDVNGGSTYVGVWVRNFTGAASIRSEPAAKP